MELQCGRNVPCTGRHFGLGPSQRNQTLFLRGQESVEEMRVSDELVQQVEGRGAKELIDVTVCVCVVDGKYQASTDLLLLFEVVQTGYVSRIRG
jgi:hypothetical protein